MQSELLFLSHVAEHVIDTVRSLPEVEGVDKFRGMQLDLFGKKVITAFADIGVKRKFFGQEIPRQEI